MERKKYLTIKAADMVSSGFTSLTIKSWQKEYSELASQNKANYSKLQETHREVERLLELRKHTDVMLREERLVDKNVDGRER